MKMEEMSVPKRRYIKFRRREITQKKTYNIFNTAPRHKEETLASFTAIIECYVIKS
jgi:hypothetical protein